MTCVNCGNPLNEGEQVCVNCGTPVTSENPIPVDTMVEQKVEETTPVKPKKNVNKKFVLGILIAAVVLLVVGFVCWYLLSNRVAHGKSTVTGDLFDYGGYTFAITEKYNHYNSNVYGLVVSDDHMHFSIYIDYTNKWKAYKKFFESKYDEDTLRLAHEMVADREYYLFRDFIDGKYSYRYFCTTKHGDVVAGLITLNDYAEMGQLDIFDIDKFIRTGVRVPSFTDVDKYDYGKNGVRMLDTNVDFYDNKELQES